MANMRLFHEGAGSINPDRARKEPEVWIRRLKLVEALDPGAKTIRDIEFRRGLNIIATAKAGPDDREPVGHSVGKTLLLRMIRYSLGEQTFCKRAVRRAISRVLKDAYLFAEIRVSGKSWSVARPIGLDLNRPSSWVFEGEDLDRLSDGPRDARDYSHFEEVLSHVTASPFAGVVLPHANREAKWLDLLAWLSRDQECRYRHQGEWRDPESESRTARLDLEDASLVIRMAMDLLDDEEKRLQGTHRLLLADRKHLSSDIERLRSLIEMEGRSLQQAVKTDVDISAGEIFGSAAEQKAKQTEDQLRRLLEEEQDNPEARALADKLRGLDAAAGRIKAHMEDAKSKIDAERPILQQMEQATAEQFYASFAELGQKWCHLFQTREEAIERGCPGSPSVIPPGEKSPDQERRISECRNHISTLEEILANLEGQLKRIEEQREQTQRKYDDALRKHNETLGGIREKIGEWRGVQERAKRYSGLWASLSQKERELEALEKKIEDSLERQRAARSRLADKQAALSRYFDYALKALIGPSAGGKIEIDSRGIWPRPSDAVAASGEALSTSAKVHGFDLACLIGHVCGLGRLPGLLIHDSPREADMEDALYHRLFRLVAELESIFGSREPSFQYIIATTTPPPAELDCEPYVRLRLDARQESSLLFGTRFTTG